MSLDASDFIEALMDEQARKNAAFVDQPDANATVQDLVAVATPAETIGFTETLSATVAGHTPHKWDDTPLSNTSWNFFQWDT